MTALPPLPIRALALGGSSLAYHRPLPVVREAAGALMAVDHSLARVPIEDARKAPIPIGFAYPVVHANRRPVTGMFSYLLNAAENGSRRRTGSFCDDTNRFHGRVRNVAP